MRSSAVVGESHPGDRVPERGSILIAGGGTAGHVLPGLAVADELVARGHSRSSIHFVGSARGPEADLVSAAGFGITLLPGRGIQRKLTLENLRSARDLLRGVWTAVRLVRRCRPSVVLVLGGYASFAAALASVLWRAPMVVADQNARAGAVNRLAAPFARVSAVPFESTDLPHKVVVGNPVRPEIREPRSESERPTGEGSARPSGRGDPGCRVRRLAGSPPHQLSGP